MDPDSTGNSLLTYAVTYNQFEVVKCLVEQFRMDINQRNMFNHTPLYFARINGFEEIEEFLVQNGAIE